MTGSARRARNRFAEHLAVFYCKPMFWHRAYCIDSVGGASLETVRVCVESQQGTKPLKRNPA
ncbi:transposase [Ectothiorhodospira magna]|uniref:transposase n=1 Tax=Ectothiorhodospira magna TaxID=867345 RepID=UPI00192E45BF